MDLSTGISFLTFLLGLLLGHRLKLSNERRKEFNESASPIYYSLETQRRTLERGDCPGNLLSENTFIEIQRRMPSKQRRDFITAVKNYALAQDVCGSHISGDFVLSKPEPLIKAIEELQLFLSHK